MHYPEIAQQIIELKNEDLRVRDQLIQKGLLAKGYHEEMKAVHDKNADVLGDILDEIGYPTIDKVGEEGSQAAWLVIQHAIGQPTFMKRCATLLEAAVKENQADPKNLAYLSDRIAIFEQKTQLYGTQFDWDEKGELSPQAFDDLAKVNQRRKSIGLNTLEEQTEIIRKQAKKEKELPPEDTDARKAELQAWLKSVGWIN
ncbi:MAG: DUF6624 domain-containing protein [Bacteroidia bacterium]|nr:DUF6624 domain-containing protein [Bacteroidia bacterium]